MSEEKKVINYKETEGTEGTVDKKETQQQTPVKGKEKKSVIKAVTDFVTSPRTIRTVKKIPGITLKVVGGLFMAVKVYDMVTGHGKTNYSVSDATNLANAANTIYNLPDGSYKVDGYTVDVSRPETNDATTE